MQQKKKVCQQEKQNHFHKVIYIYIEMNLHANEQNNMDLSGLWGRVKWAVNQINIQKVHINRLKVPKQNAKSCPFKL